MSRTRRRTKENRLLRDLRWSIEQYHRCVMYEQLSFDDPKYLEKVRRFHQDWQYSKRLYILKSISKRKVRAYTRNEIEKVYSCNDYDDYEFDSKIDKLVKSLWWYYD